MPEKNRSVSTLSQNSQRAVIAPCICFLTNFTTYTTNEHTGALKMTDMKMTDHQNCRAWNCRTWNCKTRQISLYCCLCQSQ